MEFPKRPPQHVAESQSFKILKAKAPEDWIIREVSERDYGIDLYLEIQRKDGSIAGDMVSIQLKGVEKLEWKSNKVKFSGIKKATINYWMRLQVPVFLLVVDLTEERVYFCSIEKQVMRTYDALLKQESLSFELESEREIGTAKGNSAFIYDYIFQRYFEEKKAQLKALLNNHTAYLGFIKFSHNRDHHAGIEANHELFFVGIHRAIMVLSPYFQYTPKTPALDQIYKSDREFFPDDDYYRLHQHSLNLVLLKVREDIIELLKIITRTVTEEERCYWDHHDRLLTEACDLIKIQNVEDMDYYFDLGS